MANLLQDFLCMNYSFKNSLYIKKISRWKKNFQPVFVYSIVKNLFLLLPYTLDSLRKKKKKLKKNFCLFWMAKAKATLVSLTLLFSSS